MTLLDHALRLAELGWQVFALGPTGFPFPNCKTCSVTCPTSMEMDACDHLICHAAYAGTTDTPRLEAMWGYLPHALIGVRTGAASGLIVLDFDMHPGGADGIATFRKLRDEGAAPRTVSARTGGGGVHLYYRHPGTIAVPNDNRGKLGPACDVKGEGGYVVAAPSAKRGRPAYLWADQLSPWDRPLANLPDAVLAAIMRKPDERRPASAEPMQPGEAASRFEAALDRLRGAEKGERNHLLHWVACRAGEAVGACELSLEDARALLEQAASDAGMEYRRDGVPGTIRSGLNRGLRDAVKGLTRC